MNNEPNTYGRHGMRETNPLKATNRYAAFDLIDDPVYEDRGLSVSTDHDPRKRSTIRWAVYYHGRLLHGGLSSSAEANIVRNWYAAGTSSSNDCWQLITNKGKQPSPSTDHRRKAGLA